MNSDLLSDECSVPAVHSEGPGAPLQDRTAYALECVSWRTPHRGNDQCRGPGGDWPGPWSSPAGLGWGAEVRVSNTQTGWQHYTLHTLKIHKKESWICSVVPSHKCLRVIVSAFWLTTHRGCEGWMTEALEVPSHPSPNPPPHLPQNHL